MPVSSPRVAIAVVAGIVLAITGFTLLGVSFQVVGLDQFGLVYDRTRMTVVPGLVLDPGRSAYGPGATVLLFPRTLQTLEWSNDTAAVGPGLRARTAEGLAVTLEVSFQYQLVRGQLHQLLDNFGMDYRRVFALVTQQVVRDVAANFTAFSFFVDRSSIAAEIELRLSTVFADQLYADVQFFQLRQVNLPPVFESAINQAQVAQQDVSRATFQQQTALVEAETRRLQALAAANVTLKLANSTAVALGLQAQARATALNLTVTATANVLGGLQRNLSLGTDVLRLQWTRALSLGQVVVGVNKALLSLLPGA